MIVNLVGHQQPHNIVAAQNKKKRNDNIIVYEIKKNGINQTENNNHN
jgi:hypothetical protein